MDAFLIRTRGFLQKETVLVIAFILAVASSVAVAPDRAYLSYIDYDTLLLLFGLMAVMAGFQELGIFQAVGDRLLSRIHDTRQMIMVLVFLPFFFSMVITNDVALITFVPFAIIVLRLSGQEKALIPVTVLQTVAANLGSMLTPMGNPQNLYLYAKSGMSLFSFIELMLPYTVVSGISLMAAICFMKKDPLDKSGLAKDPMPRTKIQKDVVRRTVFFCIGSILCLLCVAKIVAPVFAAAAIGLYLVAAERALFKKIDFSLLGTFICFFVFIGNMGRIESFCAVLERFLTGHERIVAVLASQVISNVPAALLLSGFTQDYPALIVGTDLGGLGTLIASMASLISYKQVAREYPALKGRYLACFTLINIILLLILLFLSIWI